MLRLKCTYPDARQRTAPDEFPSRHRLGGRGSKSSKIGALCRHRNPLQLPLNFDVLRTRNSAKGNSLPRRSTRNAILEAAMKQFIERGFSACSVEDITKAARVPKGSFFAITSKASNLWRLKSLPNTEKARLIEVF